MKSTRISTTVCAIALLAPLALADYLPAPSDGCQPAAGHSLEPHGGGEDADGVACEEGFPVDTSGAPGLMPNVRVGEKPDPTVPELVKTVRCFGQSLKFRIKIEGPEGSSVTGQMECDGKVGDPTCPVTADENHQNLNFWTGDCEKVVTLPKEGDLKCTAVNKSDPPPKKILFLEGCPNKVPE